MAAFGPTPPPPCGCPLWIAPLAEGRAWRRWGRRATSRCGTSWIHREWLNTSMVWTDEQSFGIDIMTQGEQCVHVHNCCTNRFGKSKVSIIEHTVLLISCYSRSQIPFFEFSSVKVLEFANYEELTCNTIWTWQWERPKIDPDAFSCLLECNKIAIRTIQTKIFADSWGIPWMNY